jgi:hypothetical protein
MREHRARWWAWLTGILIAVQAGPALAVQPSAGAYGVNGVVTDRACPPVGDPYLDSQPTDSIVASLYYPGANKAGAKVIFPIETHDPFLGSVPNQLVVLTMPKTPPAGVTTWQGTAAGIHSPSGASVSFDFNWQMNFADRDALTFILSVTSNVNGPCTLTIYGNAMRTGNGPK